MATTDSFDGKDCPLCGAVDSLETDPERGEVACTECAKVIAMGLEESVLTRFNDGATYQDADARGWGGGGGDDAEDMRRLVQADGSGARSRAAAAAAAAGNAVKGAGSGGPDMNTEAGREARYARTVLHPKMRSMIDNLTRISRRAVGVTNEAGENPIRAKALSIARTYVGYRREFGRKVDHINEVAAACFQIASEMNGEPVPLAELRVLDPSLKNVEAMRREIITDTRMEQTEAKLRESLAGNLTTYFLRLLHVQLIRYEEPVAVLLRAMTTVAASGGPAAKELMQLVEAERVMAAVLLARTQSTLTWEGKPAYNPASEPPPATAYASFAASAHLNAARVEKVMQAVVRCLPEIVTTFHSLMKAEKAKRTESGVATAASAALNATGPTSTGLISGVKRERSPASSAP